MIQPHNELRDLQAEMLRMVCNGVETEPVLQDITGEELNRGGGGGTCQHRTRCATGYCSKGILGKAEVGFLRCKNLPPK